MPFKALTSKGESVYSWDYATSGDLRMRSPFTCPHCESEMFVRQYKGRMPHFYHASGCTSQMERQGESTEHILGKQLLLQHAKDAIAAIGNKRLTVDAEFALPNVGQHGRIADLMISCGSRPILALECQISVISDEQIIHRTRDYKHAGIQPLWILGEGAWQNIRFTNCIRKLQRFAFKADLPNWQLFVESHPVSPNWLERLIVRKLEQVKQQMLLRSSCKRCGCIVGRVLPSGNATHEAKLACWECGNFQRWVSKREFYTWTQNPLPDAPVAKQLSLL